MTTTSDRMKQSPEGEIRVLVVENDQRTRKSHGINLKRWGYVPIFAEGRGNALLEDARQKIRDAACHLAVVDMRLINDHDRRDESGLSLIPELKPALTIVASGSGDNRRTTRAVLKKYGALDFVNKNTELHVLEEILQEAAQEMVAGSYGPEVIIDPDLVEQIMMVLAPGKPEQVCELLKAMFPTAKTIAAEPIGGEAQTPRISSWQSSTVLKVTVDRLQPFAVKLSKLERIRNEIHNYKQFVRDQVIGRHYIGMDLDRCKERWHIGGIVYPYNDNSKVFLAYFIDSSVEMIREALTNLFTSWISLYTDSPKEYQDSLFHRYYLRWGGKEWIERLDQYISALNGNEELATFHDLVGIHQNPVVWAKRRTGEWGENPALDRTRVLTHRYEYCGHGDLQGDNFFVDDNGRCLSIDHERTGYGPIFQDFVLLELDIWVRVAGFTENRDILYMLQYAVSKQIDCSSLTPTVTADTLAYKTWHTITCIRELAAGINNLDARIYYWGLLLNTIFRIVSLQNKLESVTAEQVRDSLQSQLALTQLVGVVLAHRLDHWDKPWPPPEWNISPILPSQPPSPDPGLRAMNRPIKILFVAANPVDTTQSNLQEEIRAIHMKIRDADFRDELEIIPLLAARAGDLLEAMNRHEPDVVHFSGHGVETGEILFVDKQGNNTHPVNPETLTNLFRVVGDNVQLVMLNACYSELQAQAISSVIDFTIGMSQQIEDDAAILFAAQFYGAAGYGRTIQNCFEQGKLAIELEGVNGENVPVLLFQPTCDPAQSYLLQRANES